MTGGNTTVAAVAGYPSTPFHGTVHDLRSGSPSSAAVERGALIRQAHAFEQQTRARVAPRFLPR